MPRSNGQTANSGSAASVSTNGTWLNGQQVRDDVPLYVGDKIRLGTNLFELVAVPVSFEPRPRHRERSGRDRLGPVVAVTAILAAIATTIGVAYTIFVRPSSDVADYQKQVLATCDQVRAIVTADHGEILQPGPDGIRIRKDLLIRITESNLAQARESFDALNRRAVPADLAAEHDAAVAAQEAWLQAMQDVLETIRSEVPEDATVQEWTSMGVDLGGGRTAITRLNSAMTGLAGENCSVS